MIFQPGTRRPAGHLGSFRDRVAQIEADFAAGKIGASMRRDLLIQARDASGIPQIATRTAQAHAQTGGQGGKLIGTNDNAINAAKQPHRDRKRGPAPRCPPRAAQGQAATKDTPA
ncbi:hypothetical protein ACIU1J_27475 [Azospirillum doebereinerae]|uniref:hypothetical protein n=1 Tax=Azospirillum doebereinerae TaxID=92933 RepID=UPI001EE60F8E|nr:hypothetical protein [Azospirillum doebereinerae]MCG5241360.1 hypothetical protein [Azospirillum doebereinerae]